MARSARQKAKINTFNWMAKLVKLEEAIEQRIDLSFICVRCCTCGNITERGTKNCQAGHFIGRGMGGSSGVYFDRRNVHVQCAPCNAFLAGNFKEYEKFMFERYDSTIIDNLLMLHKTHKYTLKDIIGLGLYYKSEYERLCKEYGIK